MKTMKINLSAGKKWLAASLLLLGCSGFAQGLQDSLRHEDDDIVSSIAPYPADVREAILDVSQYPQKLVKIGRLQARTSQSFQDLVTDKSRDIQEKLYDLARYPNLVNQLASGSQKSPSDLKSVLSAYPEEVAASAGALYTSNFKDLQAMNINSQQSEKALYEILKPLSDQTQSNFKKVIAMPDIMTLLTDRIDLTVSLGEAYKSNPDDVRQNLSDLNSQLSTQNAKDLDAYKQQVASDPQLQEEMKKSSQEFAENYSESGTVPTTVVNNNYYSSTPAYPYWFGYPYWYPSPVWYPQPLYYHTGFYVGQGGGIVVIGLPSYAYSNWFFNYGYRRYPRMYGRYNAYYNYHYRPTVNVYRGYNSAVREHFNRVNNITPSTGRTGGTRTRYDQQGVIGNNDVKQRGDAQFQRQPNALRERSTQNFRNSINSNGSNISSQRMNNFNSQQFHQQGWQRMQGLQRPSMQRGGNPGGAQRSGTLGGGGNGSGGGTRRGRN